MKVKKNYLVLVLTALLCVFGTTKAIAADVDYRYPVVTSVSNSQPTFIGNKSHVTFQFVWFNSAGRGCYFSDQGSVMLYVDGMAVCDLSDVLLSENFQNSYGDVSKVQEICTSYGNKQLAFKRFTSTGFNSGSVSFNKPSWDEANKAARITVDVALEELFDGKTHDIKIEGMWHNYEGKVAKQGCSLIMSSPICRFPSTSGTYRRNGNRSASHIVSGIEMNTVNLTGSSRMVYWLYSLVDYSEKPSTANNAEYWENSIKFASKIYGWTDSEPEALSVVSNLSLKSNYEPAVVYPRIRRFSGPNGNLYQFQSGDVVNEQLVAYNKDYAPVTLPGYIRPKNLAIVQNEKGMVLTWSSEKYDNTSKTDGSWIVFRQASGSTSVTKLTSIQNSATKTSYTYTDANASCGNEFNYYVAFQPAEWDKPIATYSEAEDLYLTKTVKVGHGYKNAYTPKFEWGGTGNAPECKYSLTCNDCKAVLFKDIELTSDTLSYYGYIRLSGHADAQCNKIGNSVYKAYGYYGKGINTESKLDSAIVTKEYSGTYASSHGNDNYYEASYVFGGTAQKPTVHFTLKCNDCGTYVVNNQELTTDSLDYGFFTITTSKAATCTVDGTIAVQARGKYRVHGSREFGTDFRKDRKSTSYAMQHGHGHNGYRTSFMTMGDGSTGNALIYCNECNTRVTAYRASGSTEDMSKRIEATCTSPGSRTFIFNVEYAGGAKSDGGFDIPFVGTYENTVTVKSQMKHAGQAHEAKAATCTEEGNDAYWQCADCHKCFSDEDCKVEIDLSRYVIAATHHANKVARLKAASCTETGLLKHWYCNDCSQMFTDEACTVNADINKLTISAIGHAPKYVSKKDATCLENGNEAAWFCAQCGNYYTNSNCIEEAELAFIPALGHIWQYTNGFGSCSRCDEERYQDITAKNGVYEITNGGQLFWFANRVNTGGQKIKGKLTKDITLDLSREWTPIGTKEEPFMGEFDGQRHKISGLLSQSTNASFIEATDSALVTNLGIVSSNFSSTGGASAAFVAYGKNTDISNCYANATVKNTIIAGICALGDNVKISRSFSYGSLTTTGTGTKKNGICNKETNVVIENSYYQTTSTTTTSTAKTKDQFASGEVTYLLNLGLAEPVWYQTLPTDKYPVYSTKSKVVYKHGNIYSNDEEEVIQLAKVGDYYYTSLYKDYAFVVDGEGAEVYVANNGESEDVLIMSAVTGTVPAGTGVIIRSTGSSVRLVMKNGSDDPIRSVLSGTFENVLCDNELVFGAVSGKVGFYNYKGKTITAGKAYYKPSASVKSLTILFEDGETVIADAANYASVQGSIYSLDGVKSNTLRRGLNIIKSENGSVKKVLVK